MGGGSSFDAREYQGRARQMAVLNRRANLTDEERAVLAIVEKDPEIRDLQETVEATTARWQEKCRPSNTAEKL
jgi:hypothetical protein